VPRDVRHVSMNDLYNPDPRRPGAYFPWPENPEELPRIPSTGVSGTGTCGMCTSKPLQGWWDDVTGAATSAVGPGTIVASVLSANGLSVADLSPFDQKRLAPYAAVTLIDAPPGAQKNAELIALLVAVVKNAKSTWRDMLANIAFVPFSDVTASNALQMYLVGAPTNDADYGRGLQYLTAKQKAGLYAENVSKVVKGPGGTTTVKLANPMLKYLNVEEYAMARSELWWRTYGGWVLGGVVGAAAAIGVWLWKRRKASRYVRVEAGA